MTQKRAAVKTRLTESVMRQPLENTTCSAGKDAHDVGLPSRHYTGGYYRAHRIANRTLGVQALARRANHASVNCAAVQQSNAVSRIQAAVGKQMVKQRVMRKQP